MKRILCSLCILSVSHSLMAQEPADALRFSWTTPGGSARTQAIGGAMGSLGGDITANFVNPAGLAFYKTGDIIITPLYQFGKTKATYLNRKDKDQKNQLALGTSGFVIGSGDNNKKNLAFSVGFNRAADFNSNILYRGSNPQSSYSQKYLEEIRGDRSGNSVSDQYPFGASLGFRSYWIDTVGGGTEGNFNFQSRASKLLGTGLVQEQSVENRGGISEIAISGAVSKNDKIMFGGSIGIPILRYERNSTFSEADATDNPNNNFDFATVEERLITKGAGLNLKLGLIYKPEEFWRLGLAFHTPTVYTLTDNYDVNVTANVERANNNQTLTSYSTDFTNDQASAFQYTLVTPYKAIASVSYVLREIEDVTKQRGFLTADVEYVNYKSSSFMEDEEDSGSNPDTRDYLKSLNNTIDKAYKGAFNLRAGGELKFTTFMVRLGAAYFGNPYKNINGEKGSKLNLSGGLGYRDQGFFIDLTYVHSMQKDIHFAYRLEDRNQYSAANLKSNVGNVLLTVGKKF